MHIDELPRVHRFYPTYCRAAEELTASVEIDYVYIMLAWSKNPEAP
jgi:hypothetical protein